MPLSRLFALAIRQLWRETRAGELCVLFFALLTAVAASTAIGYFSYRLNLTMQRHASEFLGADLVLNGTTPAQANQLSAGYALGLKHAKVVEFSSVIATDQQLMLSSIKAADSTYPLRGELRSSAAPGQAEQPSVGPQPGEAWAEARLLATLELNIGDNIEVGRKSLRLTRVLTYEPDRAGDLYSLTPHVLIHIDDLAATGVVQPGSRVRYRDLWAGSNQQLSAYQQQISQQLAPSQRIETVRDENRQLNGALGRAERYLNLASLAAVLLAGVAVALSANRFAQRRFDNSALLRCLGLSCRDTLCLYLLQLAVLGLIASLAGALLGWLAQQGLFVLLSQLLTSQVVESGVWPMFTGMATGMVALAGFALPPLLALGRVPPLRVLKRDLAPLPASSWLLYGAALLALALIMWRLTLDLTLTSALLGGGLLVCLILGMGMVAGLRRLRRTLAHAPLPWRLGIGQLLRHPVAAAGQTLAFGLILLAMALVALLRDELLETWQAQLPPNAPNYFALNILPSELDSFQQHVAQLSDFAAPLYPVIPGRLVSINELPAQGQAAKNSQGERATRRDLNLTWSAQLPSDNQIVAGQWWEAPSSSALLRVSVEAELAKSFGLNLGDKLTFNIAGITRDVQVSSLRKVSWDSFQPNFFMIFEPGALDNLPTTFLTSFHLPAGNEPQLIQLARDFPAVTLLQIDSLLEQLRDILAQVSLAVEYVLLFVLAAGVAVLLAGLQATLDERIHQGALLRALGAPRQVLQKARGSEFALLGAASGCVAALGCELVSALLYQWVFKITWHPHPWLLTMPVIGALLVTSAGLWGTHRALQASPLLILRES